MDTLEDIEDALNLLDDNGAKKQRFNSSCFDHFLRIQYNMNFFGVIVNELLIKEMYHDGPNDEMRFVMDMTECRFTKREFCHIMCT